jgi:hypothetical protein
MAEMAAAITGSLRKRLSVCEDTGMFGFAPKDEDRRGNIRSLTKLGQRFLIGASARGSSDPARLPLPSASFAVRVTGKVDFRPGNRGKV